MSNLDVRTAAASAKVRLWEIADELGISEFTFSRKMRKELSEKEKTGILEIINRISERKYGGSNVK